ncbi:MAG: type II secretion system minor pseudopilin GspI [Burkholderiaceae bacterium]
MRPPTAHRPSGRAARRGFTLVEVLVALAIVAIALIAASQASATLTRNAQRQNDLLLAQLCADNELVRLRLLQQMPGVGDTVSPCEQGGRSFEVALTVRPTPNPSFQRVDAQVRTEGQSVLRVSTVIGRY